ncbi:MAG: two-component sensor histidine kinase, partial [Odoribacter sp.]|nr:two-component sensor histidine kinase [Odoribacter sp.]
MVQRSREKTYKAESLKSTLDAYTEVIHQFLKDNPVDSTTHLLALLPADLRLTIVDEKGNVVFDNTAQTGVQFDNHSNRPEINSAWVNGEGTVIRHSETNQQDYYYYARHFSPYFVRVALPYNLKLKDVLKGDNVFMHIIVLLFLTGLILLLYLSDRFGKAVSSLNDFIISAQNNVVDYSKIHFPDTELGEIGNKIVANFHLLEKSKNELDQEKEKLIRHFHYSNEGIAIFSSEGKNMYANTHFIQYINTILDEPTFDVENIFGVPEFKEIRIFLKNNTPVNPDAKFAPIYQGKISKNGKYFAVKL